MSSDPHRHPPAWGLLLTVIGSVSIGWLGATGQLGLYIHPRYFVFTEVMAALAALAAVAAFAIRTRTTASGRGRAAVAAAVVLVLTLLVIPPATLSNATVQQRSLNASVDTGDAVKLVGTDPSGFTVRDWAGLIADPDSAATYAGQKVTLIGFVSTMSQSSADTFYLARFVITCCAADAVPVGVPVTKAGWAGTFHPDEWVKVTGSFVPAKSSSETSLVLKPETITAVPQPAQPYEV